MFDKIASDWARKRQKPWKPLVILLDKCVPIWRQNFYHSIARNHCLFIDLGAGSGRHSNYFLQFCSRLIDLDQSREMLQKNSTNSLKIQAHMDNLPFREQKFDGICSIAALHHVKGISNRKKVIDEINRIGLPNSLVCITVWRFYQKRFLDAFISQLKMAMNGDLDHEIGDIMIPWTISQKGQNLTIKRFYHLYRSTEFSQLVRKFYRLQKGVMGNNNQKTNFYFIGINPQ
ncbi:class I SAM-dependent methyltransferase [Candidatus Lokiarchaeum ossiferum]|uniref:class I SAM-dependent methyltransferase n=1 Tax=Candidatus Lokiarchaeum ossiferum TaxID=2951803 RepID=UPI00352E0598